MQYAIQIFVRRGADQRPIWKWLWDLSEMQTISSWERKSLTSEGIADDHVYRVVTNDAITARRNCAELVNFVGRNERMPLCVQIEAQDETT